MTGRDESDAATRARIDRLLCARCYARPDRCPCPESGDVLPAVPRPSAVVRLLQATEPERGAA